MNKKVLLMILDGWGIPKNKNVSAIDHADTPFIDTLYSKYPHKTLETSGLAVGLPEGQMGNSEVGHMNIGAGRVVYQDLVKINMFLKTGSFSEINCLQNSLHKKPKKIHLLGLISDGGIHSHIDHLLGLTKYLSQNTKSEIYIHGFTDGRDTDPNSGKMFVSKIQNSIQGTSTKLASLCGRYYAMDRDKRWERIKIAYDALVRGIGEKTSDPLASIQKSYENGITDEFIKPIICNHSTIETGDLVIFFNFRTDRGRQLTEVLTQKDFPDYQMKKLAVDILTFTNYDSSFKNIGVLFEKENLNNTLGEVLSKNQKKQIRIAETEKYPHVTYFFSGGKETPFERENRILLPSPKVATYDLQPSMNAKGIRDKIIIELDKKKVDFICLNFANPDMVGHTGVFQAAVEACEIVDHCAKSVIETCLKNDYAVILIADHGNAEVMKNEDGSPNTAHTTNLVPFLLIDNSLKYNIIDGKLCDLAPTILHLMGLDIPDEMSGEVLVR